MSGACTPGRLRFSPRSRRERGVGTSVEEVMEDYFEVEPGVRLRYLIEDYTDPWRPAETVLLVHGFAESVDAWWAWIPYLARRYRVVRLDLRGFGRSTPMPETYTWSMDRLLDDIRALAKRVGAERAHLIGAKSGGSMV